MLGKRFDFEGLEIKHGTREPTRLGGGKRETKDLKILFLFCLQASKEFDQVN